MSLRFAALGLLAQEPGSGYDLMRRFENSMANVWPATQSQLYGELGRLERDGYIEIVDTGARGRKVYGATGAGRAALRDWIVDAEPTPVRSAELLRVFLLSEVDRDAAIAHFENTIAGTRATLAGLEAILAEFYPGESGTEDAAGLYGRITLEYGLRAYRTQIEWAEWARDLLAR